MDLNWWQLGASTLQLCIAYALLFSAAIDKAHLISAVLPPPHKDRQ